VAQLDQDLHQLESRLMQEGQDINLYKATREEAFRVSDAVLQQYHEVRSLSARQELLMNSIAQDADKKRAASFLLEILKKRQIRDEMQKECSISVDEEKQLLIKQAKSTREDIEILERQLNDMRDTVQESKNRLNATNEDLKEYSGDNARVYQELQEKDREMQEFIDTFPEKEREELKKIEEAEKQIVQILERVSRTELLKKQMPKETSAPGMLQALAGELSDKMAHLENAKVTHQRLEKELTERKEELNKIANLDEKIQQELQAHAQKMAEQRQDMVRYTDIERLRQEIDARRKRLLAQKAYLLKLRDTSKHQVYALNAGLESMKQQLNQNPKHVAIAAQEQKLRLIMQSNFSVEDFVRIKEKETQYLTTKAECLRITDEINGLLKDPKRTQQPVMIVGAK
jgi:intraflagellar transport protein 74